MTIFSISYLNNKNGDLIIIGNLTNEYNNKYNYENYITTPSESDDKSFLWKSLFNNFKLNDKMFIIKV